MFIEALKSEISLFRMESEKPDSELDGVLSAISAIIDLLSSGKEIPSTVVPDIDILIALKRTFASFLGEDNGSNNTTGLAENCSLTFRPVAALDSDHNPKVDELKKSKVAKFK